MKSVQNRKVPAMLKDLVKPTPSGAQMLIAAWDGLTLEHQATALSLLDQFPGYLADKIRINALESNNPYIRYLAASRIYIEDEPGSEMEQVRARIENDSEPLVKYSLFEHRSTMSAMFDDSFSDVNQFFSLPHEARLAKVRYLVGRGEQIAYLITKASESLMPKGEVSELEIAEIILDYICKDEFYDYHVGEQRYFDGYGEFTKAKELEALWRLVPRLSDTLAYLLISNLPESSGYVSNIPIDVIKSMSDDQLQTLMYRQDIYMKELRKRLFWKVGTKKGLSQAAISWNFDLSYEDFGNILGKSSEERFEILNTLGDWANDLSLCFYDAIYDVLKSSDAKGFLTGADFANSARAKFDRKLKVLNSDEPEENREITELRLYKLATTVVPWDSDSYASELPEELEFLSDKIVPNKTWETFVEFSKAWERSRYRRKGLESYLPRIYEIDEMSFKPDYEEEDLETIRHGELVRAVQEATSSIAEDLENTREMIVRDYTEDVDRLRGSIDAVIENQHLLEKNTLHNFNQVAFRIDDLKFILYILVAAVLWILFGSTILSFLS